MRMCMCVCGVCLCMWVYVYVCVPFHCYGEAVAGWKGGVAMTQFVYEGGVRGFLKGGIL